MGFDLTQTLGRWISEVVPNRGGAKSRIGKYYNPPSDFFSAHKKRNFQQHRNFQKSVVNPESSTKKDLEATQAQLISTTKDPFFYLPTMFAVYLCTKLDKADGFPLPPFDSETPPPIIPPDYDDGVEHYWTKQVGERNSKMCSTQTSTI